MRSDIVEIHPTHEGWWWAKAHEEGAKWQPVFVEQTAEGLVGTFFMFPMFVDEMECTWGQHIPCPYV